MNDHVITLSEAESDLTAAAAYLAENIGSSDGRAEALKEVVASYIAKENVDLAAALADTIQENFVRDNLLVKIAEKCAAIGDDDYAFQLADAVDDYGLQSAAKEQIAIQKVNQGRLEEAQKIAFELNHPDQALAAIAIRQFADGDTLSADKTIGEIESSALKSQTLLTIASYFQNQEDKSKISDYLNKAQELADEIDVAEEKIRILLAIANLFIETKQYDEAIKTLENARNAVEKLEGTHRESFLSAVSIDFLRAKNLEQADQTLDLIADKTQIAATLNGFSNEFERQCEHADALESLEEAYAILKSQRENEIRDSRLRFSLLNSISVRFSEFEKFERALEIALENPIEDEQQNALTQIAIVCLNSKKIEAARQAIEEIKDENSRAISLVNISDAQYKAGKHESALEFLNEAYEIAKTVSRARAKTDLLTALANRFFQFEDKEKARQAAGESLQSALKILDESHRAIAILHLGETFEHCGFTLNEQENLAVSTLLRKAEW